MHQRTGTGPNGLHPALRILILFALLYGFLVAIQLMGGVFKSLGEAEALRMLKKAGNPFAGLSIGILATVIVQSSSMTTALIVTLVGFDTIDPTIAVYAIMGCNVGTTITNTLVSLGHVRQDTEFRRAFAGATMHDIFNLMAIGIFMPLEYFTGILSKSASWLTNEIYGFAGESFDSPVKAVIKWAAEPIQKFFLEDLGLSRTVGGTIAIIAALATLFLCLIFITKNMRALIAAKLERSLNAILGKSGVLAIVIGMMLTIAVQSSSITTSLMIPLFAAGILKLENGFPVTIGANIGTTVTAMLASMATNKAGLQIALVHLCFNLGATLIIYPIPQIRRIPIRCAEKLAEIAVKSKPKAAAYVMIVFILIPLLGYLVST